jgi:hypothetical protein
MFPLCRPSAEQEEAKKALQKLDAQRAAEARARQEEEQRQRHAEHERMARMAREEAAERQRIAELVCNRQRNEGVGIGR